MIIKRHLLRGTRHRGFGVPSASRCILDASVASNIAVRPGAKQIIHDVLGPYSSTRHVNSKHDTALPSRQMTSSNWEALRAATCGKPVRMTKSHGDTPTNYEIAQALAVRRGPMARIFQLPGKVKKDLQRS